MRVGVASLGVDREVQRDHVPLVAGQERGPLRGVDDVVGRGQERVQRPRGVGVAHGAERREVDHGARRPDAAALGRTGRAPPRPAAAPGGNTRGPRGAAILCASGACGSRAQGVGPDAAPGPT